MIKIYLLVRLIDQTKLPEPDPRRIARDVKGDDYMLNQVYARRRPLLKREVEHIVPRELFSQSDDPAFCINNAPDMCAPATPSSRPTGPAHRPCIRIGTIVPPVPSQEFPDRVHARAAHAGLHASIRALWLSGAGSRASADALAANQSAHRVCGPSSKG